MKRLEAFNNLATNAWYARLLRSLSRSEHDIALEIIATYDNLDLNSFEYKLNRHFLDKERPKRWKEILELVSVANSQAFK